MASPSVARLCRVCCRYVRKSYAQKADEVINMTTPLVSNSAVMSFRRMGVSGMLALRAADDLGGAQQFGADGQMAGLCRAHIDLQPDAIAPVDQPDHDTRLIVSVGITYGQY